MFAVWRERLVEWKRKRTKVSEALGFCSKSKLTRAIREWREVIVGEKRERVMGAWAGEHMDGYR